DFIQSEVTADKSMIVTPLHSMLTKYPKFFREIWIPANDEAGIDSGSEIFRRIKAKTANLTHCPGSSQAHMSSEILRADGLGRVFDHIEVGFFRDDMNRIHVAAQTKQMDGNNCADWSAVFVTQFATGITLAALVDVRPECGRRKIESRRIDIDKNWGRPDSRDAPRRSKKAVGAR